MSLEPGTNVNLRDRVSSSTSQGIRFGFPRDLRPVHSIEVEEGGIEGGGRVGDGGLRICELQVVNIGHKHVGHYTISSSSSRVIVSIY